MTTLKQFTERRAFLLAQVSALQTDTLVEISIPDDAIIATNKEGRRFLELDPSNRGKWRWPAGGVGIVVALRDCNILLTPMRDSAAPSYAGHDTLSSGLGSSVRELLYPLETAWREGAEELVLTTKDAVICPIPETDTFGFGIELSAVVRGTANLFPELVDKKVVDVHTTFLPLKGERDLIVKYNGRERKSRGLIVFDENCNGIDILKAIRVQLDVPLAEFTVYDGEIAGGNLINRRVNAYKLDENYKPTGEIVASWVRGERVPVEEKMNPMTQVLKAFYEAL